MRINAPGKKTKKKHPHRFTKNSILIRKIIGLLREYTEAEIMVLAERYAVRHPLNNKRPVRKKVRNGVRRQ